MDLQPHAVPCPVEVPVGVSRFNEHSPASAVHRRRSGTRLQRSKSSRLGGFHKFVDVALLGCWFTDDVMSE